MHVDVTHLEVWCNTNMTGGDKSQKVPSTLSAIMEISSLFNLQVQQAFGQPQLHSQ